MGSSAQANGTTAVKAKVAFLAFCALTSLSCRDADAHPTSQSATGSTARSHSTRPTRPVTASSPTTETRRPVSRIKAYQLKQTHFFFGDNKLTISHDGMLLKNEGRLGFTVVSKAPNWDVIAYRTDEKIYKTQTLKEFEHSGLVSDYLVRLHNRNFGSKFRYNVELFGKKGVRMSGGDSTRLDFLPVKGICAPQIEAILYSAYKFPTCGGIPIRFSKSATGKDWMTGIDETGNRKVLLETLSMEALTVPSYFFDAPPGYRKTASIIEVVSGKASKTKDSGLMDLLDAGH